ncbi:thiol-disulfide oxidoreductase DCC family protein [Paenibacillus sinopodophylli]|uniref:thiol-disulfide oxidoreductase DCC family protein n=1 Tax=Paenibacillus sinopodophylli TaxID=1837342 RepID=UPI001486F982|nr:DCC1-like thiol-disulfide oxidoreductase family protein [Paenibacillus sinopodophylli]
MKTAVDKSLPIILLIDGNCLLCNGITQFVAKRDKKNQFRFAALQSAAGQKLLKEGNLPVSDIHTFVMIHAGQYNVKSEAALRVLVRLDGWWKYCNPLFYFPLSLRDVIYDFVAFNRYRFFRNTETCILPMHELSGRFITGGIYGAEKEMDKR